MAKWCYARSVPDKLYVACSGGVDSVAAAAILSSWKQVTLVHYGHADHASHHEREIVYNLSKTLSVGLITKDDTESLPSSNKEAVWRARRYSVFHELPGEVVTAHTLDDAVEWYWITCLRGRGEYMKYRNRNVIRPFLLTEKSKLVDYALAHKLTWWEDPSNADVDFSLRNKVRSILVPAAKECSESIVQTVRARIVEKLADPAF